MVHGSGFKVKAMKEGLYSLDKYPVYPIFDMPNGLAHKVQRTRYVALET
jgi:hypothetical protein